MERLAQGAESVIYADRETVVKDRVPKGYRIRAIDDRLRKGRTRREAKVIGKVHALGFGPKLISADGTSMRIRMERLGGDLMKTALDRLDTRERRAACRGIGKRIRILHDNDIIHGDLTTSNMKLIDGKAFFIDFGLSFFSKKVEDKAVDLHLLRQALESKHYTHWEDSFKEVLMGYADPVVRKHLEKVEARGRNKAKY
ncbi:Kae1-associated serine/threonine protein kinase [Candidatus Woesearchaeota archaeon]|nr:Kae1-associated serine/threonine protein kinase [Candidatus Woesearchaeota archaeon]